MASRSFAGVILNGRPPFRPRARAEVRPAMVRSEISSLSNSAGAAKIPKTNFPDALVVSMAAPWPVRTFEADAAFSQVVDDIDQVAEIPAEPVEFPHDQGVPVAQGFEACDQLGPVILLPEAMSSYKDSLSTSAARSASRCRSVL